MCQNQACVMLTTCCCCLCSLPNKLASSYIFYINAPVPRAGLAVDTSQMPSGVPPLLDSDFMQRVLQQYSVQQYLVPPQSQLQLQPQAQSQDQAAAVTGGQAGSASHGSSAQGSPTVQQREQQQEQREQQSVGLQAAQPLVAPHFPLKHLNIVDPLLPSNNLGRSVSKASFARVKKALELGSRTLEQALLKVRVLVRMLVHVKVRMLALACVLAACGRLGEIVCLS